MCYPKQSFRLKVVLSAVAPARVRVSNRPWVVSAWWWTACSQGLVTLKALKSCKQLPCCSLQAFLALMPPRLLAA